MITVLDGGNRPPIQLEIHICDQRRSYVAGFSSEDQALDFVERRRATHAVFEMEDAPIEAEYARLLAWLYPDCPHGLSLALCAGPGHYPHDL